MSLISEAGSGQRRRTAIHQAREAGRLWITRGVKPAGFTIEDHPTSGATMCVWTCVIPGNDRLPDCRWRVELTIGGKLISANITETVK